MKMAINYRVCDKLRAHGYNDVDQCIVNVTDENPLHKYIRAIEDDHGKGSVISWFVLPEVAQVTRD